MRKFLATLILLLTATMAWSQSVIGEYHSQAFNHSFRVGVDAKYAEYEGKDVKSGKYPLRIYIEVYSLDEDKRVFLEFEKGEAIQFCNNLEELFKSYKVWQEEGLKNGFKNNFLIKPERYQADLYFAKFDKILDDKMFGKAEKQEYYAEFYYNRRSKQPRMFLRSGKANDLRLGSDFQLSGWSIIFLEPNAEIIELERLIKDAIKKLK